MAEGAVTIAAMSSLPKSKLLGALVAATALLALPAAAEATLTYVKNPLHPVVYAAADNGSGAHKIGSGRSPRVSPDGQLIAYLHEGAGHAQELKLVAASGAGSQTLMVGWQDTFYLAFSPDSTTIAALRGPELGKRKLVLIDLATGAQRTVANGYFSGFSFSPEGDELVYARAGSESFPPHSDVYRVSASGKIVFVKQLGAKKRKYGPKNELFLMNPNGSGQKRLTHTKVGPLVQGLFPTQWSANGKRLLAEFEGQDTSYAVTVDPQTGAQRPLDKVGQQGFVGTALSVDGKTVLGFTGGFEPGPSHDVATVPYGGGRVKPLVKDAFEPDWSR